jgi:hypothetical protein
MGMEESLSVRTALDSDGNEIPMEMLSIESSNIPIARVISGSFMPGNNRFHTAMDRNALEIMSDDGTNSTMQARRVSKDLDDVSAYMAAARAAQAGGRPSLALPMYPPSGNRPSSGGSQGARQRSRLASSLLPLHPLQPNAPQSSSTTTDTIKFAAGNTTINSNNNPSTSNPTVKAGRNTSFTPSPDPFSSSLLSVESRLEPPPTPRSIEEIAHSMSLTRDHVQSSLSVEILQFVGIIDDQEARLHR